MICLFSGVLSVIYILVFISVKAGIWGVHMNFSSMDTADGVPGIMSLVCDYMRWSFVCHMVMVLDSWHKRTSASSGSSLIGVGALRSLNCFSVLIG